MESVVADETVLTGSEAINSMMDERTLAFSPAPVAASSMLGNSFNPAPRSLRLSGRSFLKNLASFQGGDDEGSDQEASSLGLLPSNFLLDLETDLLGPKNIYFPETSAESGGRGRTSSQSDRNQLTDSLSSKELTSDSHEYMTTVKKGPAGDGPVRLGGRYLPQALFQSVEELNESQKSPAADRLGCSQDPPDEKWGMSESQQKCDSGVGQSNLTGHQKSHSQRADSLKSSHSQLGKSGLDDIQKSNPQLEHSSLVDSQNSHVEVPKLHSELSGSINAQTSRNQNLQKSKENHFDSTSSNQKSHSGMEQSDMTPNQKPNLEMEQSSKTENQMVDSSKDQFTVSKAQQESKSGVKAQSVGIQLSDLLAMGGKVPERVSSEHNGQEEADYTIQQIELDEDDLKELEETFSEFESSSDEDFVKASDGGNQGSKQCSTNPSKEGGTNMLTQDDDIIMLTSGNDPVDISFPASTLPGINQVFFKTPVSAPTAGSCRDDSYQLTSSDSLHFHQSGSVTEWGPSIDFGSLINMEEIDDKNKEIKNQVKPISQTGDDAQNHSTQKIAEFDPGTFQDFTGFNDYDLKPAQLKNAQGEIPLGSGRTGFDGFTGQLNSFKDFLAGLTPGESRNVSIAEGANPFGEFTGAEGANPFGEFTDCQELEDEDFIVDSTAAAAKLAEDEKNYSLGGQEVFSSTIGSVRAEDATFMNMTIGTYMAARSGEVGSLTLPHNRPEFGMPVKSPPAIRNVVSMLPADNLDHHHVNEERVSLVEPEPKTTSSSVPDHSPMAENRKRSQGLALGETGHSGESSSHQQISTYKIVDQDVPGSNHQQISTNQILPFDVPGTDQQQLLALPSFSMLEDDYSNITAEITYSNIFQLIERSDISLSNPGQLIMSEYLKNFKKSRQKVEQPSDNQPGVDRKSDSLSVSQPLKSEPSNKDCKIPERSESIQSSLGQAKSSTCTVAHIKSSDKPTSSTVAEEPPKISRTSQQKILQQSPSLTNSSRHTPKSSDDNYDKNSPLHQELNTVSNQNPNSLQKNSDNNKNNNNESVQLYASQFQETPATFKIPFPKRNITEARDTTHKQHVSGQGTSSIRQLQQAGALNSQVAINSNSVSASKPENSLKKMQHKDTTSYWQESGMLQSGTSRDFSDDISFGLESITLNQQHSTLTPTASALPSRQDQLFQPATYRMEKMQQLGYVRPPEKLSSAHPHLAGHHPLLDVTTDSAAQDTTTNTLHFQSLMLDNTNSMLQCTALEGLVSSTPLNSNMTDFHKFANTLQLAEKTILPIITPKALHNICELPELVDFPEVCCVNLSQQTSFTIKNLLDQGIKCQFSYRMVTNGDQDVTFAFNPFELKRNVTVSPLSSQNVQVLFRPKDQGEFMAVIEIVSYILATPQENRTYTLTLRASAEYPNLLISPARDYIDFEEITWGSRASRTVKIQNIGRATLPLRFNIYRKESSLCNFSFYADNSKDVSAISLTPKPAGVGSVYSISLPGRREGHPPSRESIEIYCWTSAAAHLPDKYVGKADTFHAVLAMTVDEPIGHNRSLLSEIKLQVTVGMYKLHVDQSALTISAAPGLRGEGVLKIINSGNISMNVEIGFEPLRSHFGINTSYVLVPPGGDVPVCVTYTPQPTREDINDNQVNMVLKTALSLNYVPVTGRVKTKETKIVGSAAAVNFGGVILRQSKKQKYTFISDNDDTVKVWIKNPGSAFKLLKEDGVLVESFECGVKKGQHYSVSVVFCPSDVAGYSSDLIIQILYGNRYAVPVNGYGGCSQLIVEGVQTHTSGEMFLNVGSLTPGMSVTQKITVRNVGDRCCFVKTVFYDEACQEFHPSRATVIPSSLMLPRNEAADLMLVMNPTVKEANICQVDRALVGFVKLTAGDEIARQHFLKYPGKHRQLVHTYDIPLTSTQRELVDAELTSVLHPVDTYSHLKKVTSVKKVGLFACPPEKPQTPERIISGTRSVNQVNLQDKRSQPDDWSVVPGEVHFNGGDSKKEEHVQVINFASTELNITIDQDEGISVLPLRATVKPKNTVLLKVGYDRRHFSKKEAKGRCGLIKVHGSQDTKFIMVYVQLPEVSTVSPPRPTSVVPPTEPSVSTPAIITTSAVPLSSLKIPLSTEPRPGINQTRSNSSSSANREVARLKIQASDKVIFPVTEAGTKQSQTYHFRNVGVEALSWQLTAFTPAYVKNVDEGDKVTRVDYEVFKLSPLKGRLKPDEIATVLIEFLPQSHGSFNQSWCIHNSGDNSQDLFYQFPLFAKASPSPLMNKDLIGQNFLQKLQPPSQAASTVKRPSGPTPSFLQRPITPVTNSLGSTNKLSPGQKLDSFTAPVNPVNSFNPSDSRSLAHSGVQSKSATGYKRETKKTDSHAREVVDVGPAQPHQQTPLSDSQGRQISAHPPSSVPCRPVLHSVSTNSQTLPNSQISSKHILAQSHPSRGTAKENDVSVTSSTSGIFQQTLDEDDSSHRADAERGLLLVRRTVVFPKLEPGESTTRKISLKNPTSQNVQVVLEHKPQPPFLIKIDHFTVANNKMIMYPVVFKPRALGTFKDRLVFREESTGKLLTVSLEAECVQHDGTS